MPSSPTPRRLRLAVLAGNTAAVRTLLASGANPHVGDPTARSGSSPLQRAVARGHRAVAEMLLAAGARPADPVPDSAWGPTAFATLAHRGHPKDVADWLERFPTTREPGVLLDALVLATPHPSQGNSETRTQAAAIRRVLWPALVEAATPSALKSPTVQGRLGTWLEQLSNARLLDELRTVLEPAREWLTGAGALQLVRRLMKERHIEMLPMFLERGLNRLTLVRAAVEANCPEAIALVWPDVPLRSWASLQLKALDHGALRVFDHEWNRSGLPEEDRRRALLVEASPVGGLLGRLPQVDLHTPGWASSLQKKGLLPAPTLSTAARALTVRAFERPEGPDMPGLLCALDVLVRAGLPRTALEDVKILMNGAADPDATSTLAAWATRRLAEWDTRHLEQVLPSPAVGPGRLRL